MEILVAILIIAVIAAVAFALVQRRRATAGAPGPGLSRSSRAGRHDPVSAGRDPMRAAVTEHARATDPHDVVVAEQRLQAQASQVAAGMHARARDDQHRHATDQLGYDDAAYGAPRADGYAAPADVNGYDETTGYAGTPSGYAAAPPTSDMHLDDAIDPQTGERVDGYGDPANDPRYHDRRYDGRLAADYVPRSQDDR